jgi:Heterokaryon incompatibility protein (HET)
MMREIYGKAACVFVWLGRPTRDGEFALKLIDGLMAQFFAVAPEDDGPRALLEHFKKFLFDRSRRVVFDPKIIRDLTQRHWWRRI